MHDNLKESLAKACAAISEAMDNFYEKFNEYVDEIKEALIKMIEYYEKYDEDEKPDSYDINSDHINSSTIKAAFLCSTYRKPRDALVVGKLKRSG